MKQNHTKCRKNFYLNKKKKYIFDEKKNKTKEKFKTPGKTIFVSMENFLQL